MKNSIRYGAFSGLWMLYGTQLFRIDKKFEMKKQELISGALHQAAEFQVPTRIRILAVKSMRIYVDPDSN
jgi:hypothetical protein